jgi:hypothetical protein
MHQPPYQESAALELPLFWEQSRQKVPLRRLDFFQLRAESLGQVAKVDIELVRKVLQRNEIDYETISQVLEDLEISLGEEGVGDAPATPPIKKQFVILASDPEGKLVEDLFTGWVLQIPEDQSPMEASEQLIRAAYEFNRTKRGAREPAKTITDVCEVVPAKFLRAQSIWVRTKEPVLIIRTDNQVPATQLKEENIDTE